MSRDLRKWGLMHVRKVSSQISLFSSYKQTREATLRIYGNFSWKESLLHENPVYEESANFTY